MSERAAIDGELVYFPVFSDRVAECAAALAPRFRKAGYELRALPEDPTRRYIDYDLLPEELTIIDHHDYRPKRDLDYYLDKYDVNSIRELVIPEMVYDEVYPEFLRVSDFSADMYAPYEKKLHRLMAYFDSLYEQGSGGFPVQDLGGELLRRVLRIVSEHHGYENVWLGFSPVEGMHATFDDEYVEWDTFQPEFEVDLTDNQRREAAAFVESYLGEKRRINHDESEPVLPPAGTDQFAPARLYDSVARKVRKLWSGDSTNLMREYLLWRREWAFEAIRKRRNERYYLPPASTSEFIRKNEIVFFPVQYHIESRLTVRGRPYYNLHWVMEYVSRSLPRNHELVVKPHPGQLASLPTSVVQTISQFATVIDPEYNAHDVIEASSVVVTVNNTVGFEALLHGKPVVVLGNAFYDGCGYTFDVTDPDDIHSLLATAARKPDLSVDDVLEVAWRTLAGSSSGAWKVDRTDENMDDIANSILSELGTSSD